MFLDDGEEFSGYLLCFWPVNWRRQAFEKGAIILDGRADLVWDGATVSSTDLGLE
jgi:hypothetical protein